MGFLCCGSNSAVVEDTQQAAIKQQETPSEAAAAAPTTEPVTTPSTTKTEPESPKKAEESTTSTQSTTPAPAPVVEPAVPKKEEEFVKPAVLEPAPSQPDKQVKTDPAVTAAPAASENAAVVEPAAPISGQYLSSILGSSVVKSGQSYATDESLSSSAIVAIYYAPASLLVDQTKKLEVFAAGYEPKTLDVVYIAEDKDDTYVSSGSIPSTWYSVPKISKSLKKTLKEKFSVTTTPSLIVLHPGKETVIDTSKSLDKILLLDPVAEDYDTKAYQIFQEWIKDLPMDQDVVGEVELEYEEPAIPEYTDDDDDDEDSDSDDE